MTVEVAALPRIATEDEVTANIALAPGGRIRGQVLDADAHPISGAHAILANSGISTVSDRNGRFELEGLELGEHTVTLEIGVGGRTSITRKVSLSRESPTATLNLAFEIPGRRLSGIVRYDDGTPIVGARVEMSRTNARLTRADGRFDIMVHCDGSCLLMANTAFGERGWQKVTAQTTFLEIQIPRSGSIVGTVVAPEGTTVWAKAQDAGVHSIMGKQALVTNNQFAFPSLAPGRYLLEASIDQRVATATSNVRPGEVTQVELDQADGAMVFGRAIDHASQKPVEGARCGVNLMEGARTDGHGTFRLRARRAPGRVVVMCLSRGKLGSVVASLVPGTATDVEVKVIDGPGDLGADLEPTGNEFTFIDVTDGGSASRVGIRDGDRLIAYDGLTVPQTGLYPLIIYSETRPPESTVTLRIRRADRVEDVSVQLGKARHSKFK